MKRTALTIGLVVAAVAITLGLTADRAVAQKVATGAPVDVIMLRCAAGVTDFTVKAFDGSSAAPSKRSDNCPEAVAQLMQSGFTVQHVHTNDDADLMVMTLVRR